MLYPRLSTLDFCFFPLLLPRSLQVPEEIHNQCLNGGRAEKAKLLKMFLESGLGKASGSKPKNGPFWISFPRNEQPSCFTFLIAQMFTLLRIFEKLLWNSKGYPGAMPPYMAKKEEELVMRHAYSCGCLYMPTTNL